MAILEQAIDRVSGGVISGLREETVRQSADIVLLSESVTRLEQALYSAEWQRLTMAGEQEFSREGIRMIVEITRIMRLKNPTIKRAVDLQRLYVWAQGVNVSAPNDQINDVIQEFVDDERNRVGLTSQQAYSDKEVSLQQDGNLFFRFFINETTGRVRIRVIDSQEIDMIICNPEDSKEPWFYRRAWAQIKLDGSTEMMAEYYPDFRFVPKQKAGFTLPQAGEIGWDTPVYHIAVNKMGNWGVPELYAALDWAVAYKNFLEQLASVWSGLARYAAQLTVKGGKRGVSAARDKLNTGWSSGSETNPSPVAGATFIASEGTNLQPFRTAGATISADDGRRLFLQAAAVAGFPETFFGDVSVGSLATAKSLDRPTELKILDRQSLWSDVIRDILNFVLLQAAKAKQGALRGIGKYKREPDGLEYIEYVEWATDIDSAIKVQFPPIVESDAPVLVGAMIDAIGLKGSGGGIPAEIGVRELLNLLGVPDIDKVMELWNEEAAERAIRSEELAAQFDKGDQGDDDDGADEANTEAWNGQVIAVKDLLERIGESMNGDIDDT